MNQSLIDEIVTNVLAQLQQSVARPIKQVVAESVARPATLTQPDSVARPAKGVESVLAATTPLAGRATQDLRTSQDASGQTVTHVEKPATTTPSIELASAVITGDMLETSVRPGQTVKIGRHSILTPSARDWLHSKRIAWSRLDRTTGSKDSGGNRSRWRMILQSMTPTVRALQDGLRRMSESWKVEVVGQPLEAVTLATSLICTAESDGVVIFTEQAELIACHANRNDRVRAAVMQNSKQWEQVMRTLGANVVCINPIGRTLMELRNLVRDCGRV